MHHYIIRNSLILFKIILFLGLNSSSLLFPQNIYYTFSDLRGLEDPGGNTHLFYRLNTQYTNTAGYECSTKDIYHYTVNSGLDSVFLESGSYSNPIYDFSHFVIDYEFWNNDPAKYIYCGVEAGVCAVSFIQRYDDPYPSYTGLGASESIEISYYNDSTIYANDNSSLLISLDGGKFFDYFNTPVNGLICLSPLDSNCMFISSGEALYRTTDGGITFSLSDTAYYNYYIDLIFDNQASNVYRIVRSNQKFMLRFSDDNGNYGSWSTRFSSDSYFYASVDPASSGHIYITDFNNIYFSDDFCQNLDYKYTLSSKIIGLYKKPSSDVLYAITKYNLYEISGDSIIVLKSLQPDPALNKFYPLAAGNKWIYKNIICTDDIPPVPCDTVYEIMEVIGDTLLTNGYNYFIIRDMNDEINYERYDSLTGTIKRYTGGSVPGSEYIIEHLAASEGDTLYTNRFSPVYNCVKIFTGGKYYTIFNENRMQKLFEVEDIGGHSYSLLEGIGIDTIYYGFDFGYGIISLQGCIINGEIFGDTTIVNAENVQEQRPMEFSLYQNYPNPFNNSTKIKYSVPQTSMITLKIFDILGNEVTTLVNEEQSSGEYIVDFTSGGTVKELASGLYFYQFCAAYGDGKKFLETKKLILLK